MNDIWILLVLLATVAIYGILFWRFFSGRYGKIKTAKARVVDKFKSDQFTKIYSSAAKPAVYTIVFEIQGKKRSFRVSEFSYRGYRVGESGTLKYRGSRLIDFH